MKDGKWNGEVIMYDTAGEITRSVVYVNGSVSRCLTHRLMKTKREEDLREAKKRNAEAEFYELHEDEITKCVLCLGLLKHNAPSYAYTVCGHRTLCTECVDGGHLPGRWTTTCMTCKQGGSTLLRVFG